MIPISITGQKYILHLTLSREKLNKIGILLSARAMNIIRKVYSILGDKDATSLRRYFL